jgi:sugar phosphate isomerase/epimerase
VCRVVEQAKFGVIADLDVVLATKCGIASVNSTIVTVITAKGKVNARAINAAVNSAGVEVVAINWVNLTSLAYDTALRAAKVGEWASCILASSIGASVLCTWVGVITVLDGDVYAARSASRGVTLNGNTSVGGSRAVSLFDTLVRSRVSLNARFSNFTTGGWWARLRSVGALR